jgi:lipopolysaccharide export system permease protein
MLFQSSIRRELARSFGATFVVLITIVLTIVLIRTLGQASRGSVNPQDVVLFMGYAALGRLPTILTLSLLVAMVSTLSRMYRDSEMVVWLGSGQSLTSLLTPLFRFAWPVLLIIFLTALFVWPWTNQQTKAMQDTYGGRSDIDRIAPGQFQESSSGNRVFFIDRQGKSETNTSSNIFIATNEKGKSSVTTATAGRIETRGESRYVLLENGQRFETENGKAAQKISLFEEYGSKAGDAIAPTLNAKDQRLMSIAELVSPPSSSTLAELAWRISLGLSAINFVVLAVALTKVNPRGGSIRGLAFVALTFVAYYNLINLGQSWIFTGQVGFAVVLVGLHGAVLVAGLAWLAKRDTNWTLRSALRGKQLQAKGHA